jgi:uncharacterized protein (TIGR03435 family)
VPNRILQSLTRLLLTGLAGLILPLTGSAQTSSPVANPDAVKMFHPAPPLASYEVATIKKADPGAQGSIAAARSGGGGPRPGQQMGDGSDTLQHYILEAYGASTRSQAQLVGGPAWITSDKYVIHGKAFDELREAMQKMTLTEQKDQNRAMEQSLLLDRFHLKAHFETRQLPVFELTPAIGGLKIKPAADLTAVRRQRAASHTRRNDRFDAEAWRRIIRLHERHHDECLYQPASPLTGDQRPTDRRQNRLHRTLRRHRHGLERRISRCPRRSIALHNAQRRSRPEAERN